MLEGDCCLAGSRRALYTEAVKLQFPRLLARVHEGSPRQTPHYDVMGLQGNLSSTTVSANATATQRLTGVWRYLFEQSA